MQSKLFQEAVTAYSQLLKEDRKTFNLRNRSTAYLCMGKFAEALADLEEVQHIENEDPYHINNAILGDSDGIRIGVVHWVSGNESKALRRWSAVLEDHEAGRITHTDAAGGIEAPCIAWFAGVERADTSLVRRAERMLKKRLRNKPAASWPGAIGAFVLGRITETDLIAAASTSLPLKKRHLCQARFWAGLLAKQTKNLKRSATLFKQSADSNQVLEDEMFLAAAEYAKLGNIK